MMENCLDFTIDKLLYYIGSNNLKNPVELKKFVYTHDISDEKMKKFKNCFEKYGEMAIYICLFAYKSKHIKTKDVLKEKIKGF